MTTIHYTRHQYPLVSPLTFLLLIITLLFSVTLTSASISGHGQSYTAAWVEILEPTALGGQKIPMQLAQFSIVPPLTTGLTAYLTLMDPIIGCSALDGTVVSTPQTLKTSRPPISSEWTNTIVLVERGDCQFIEKANVIEQLGGVGFILSNTVDTIIPIPIASTDGSQPSRYLPIIGGSILGRDGNFLKSLLQRGIPVRVKVMASGNIKPL